jgi:eukaryotic-like serine/threonine-protein kinase
MSVTIERLAAALSDRYRIERELGAGGMATVYLAHDLKHDRKVALKVLKPELAAVLGAERFVVEIKTTAALQHPHILPLFDSGTADGFLYYVMPFIDGETLRSKLDRETQLGIDESVRIASAIADALDYAHRHGVIHRDIKPENILLHDGRPMVADFGIALALSAAAGGRMTETGLSLGTPHYMSPEQATAEKEISARSDVYSLASVLYEMLAGQPPHTGGSAQQIIMKIITEAAQPVTRLRKSVPDNVSAAVAKALEKLPADRFETAGAFRDALADPHFTTARMTTLSSATATPGVWLRDRRSIAAIALASLAIIALGATVMNRGEQASSIGSRDVVRATLTLGDSVVVRGIGNSRLAISPSGKRIAFVGPSGVDGALWLRDLDQANARELPDTKGAFGPFFSPDGESIGFFAEAGGRTYMKVIALAGGVARTVVADSVAQFGGADWADDGNIYFTDAGRGLARVSAGGGALTHIAQPDSATGYKEYDFPDILPGNRFATVMLWSGSIASNHIGVINLKSGKVTEIAAGSYARYVEPGLLAIGTFDGRILIAPIDVRKGTLTGTPVLVMDDVQREMSNGTVQFAVSSTGTLLYQPGVGLRSGLVWVDREGQQTPVDSTLVDVTPNVAISPDGNQIAISRSASGDNQIWIKQLSTGALSRVSFDVTNADRPVWTPDGRSVAFLATRNNRRTAWVRPANGTGTTAPASPGDIRLDEILFDASGRYTLLRTEGTGPGTRHLLVVRKGLDTLPQTLVDSPFDNYAMALSPDGKWLAFTSSESGTPEIHVRPFPNVDSTRYVISVGGGNSPVWSRDGAELFFRTPRGQMFAVPVTTGRAFSYGMPKLLFTGTALGMQDYYRGYDVHPDGKRFLMVASGGNDSRTLNVVFNWRTELASQLKAPN